MTNSGNIFKLSTDQTRSISAENVYGEKGAGGGFVFNQVHAIQPLVSPENICTFFETAFKYGPYPIK